MSVSELVSVCVCTGCASRGWEYEKTKRQSIFGKEERTESKVETRRMRYRKQMESGEIDEEGE